MSALLEITQEIGRTKRVTPTIVKQINILLWSREFNQEEMKVLRQLERILSSGNVTFG